MIGEDARNRETESSGAVGCPQLTEDRGDSAGVFIPIVEFSQPSVSTDVRGPGQPGL